MGLNGVSTRGGDTNLDTAKEVLTNGFRPARLAAVWVACSTASWQAGFRTASRFGVLVMHQAKSGEHSVIVRIEMDVGLDDRDRGGDKR